MCIDDFDLGQVDDCGDGYFNEDAGEWAAFQPTGAHGLDIVEDETPTRLAASDYADIFLENFQL